jgi:hypothetical protein
VGDYYPDARVVFDTRKASDDNWVCGTIVEAGKEYHFEAKTFSEPSHYGYYHGRMSKIGIYGQDRKCIFGYDRGPDVTTPEGREILKILTRMFRTIKTPKQGKIKFIEAV